ncbi:MAG: carbohydrate porin [Chroococcidiopsidaceae cyanobacterium CP_BM_ER_R8_30]|nr:carbohydrate porin [Chroococcidiopsidaceae cyanobacterium CP_BM_ER_R8_30]
MKLCLLATASRVGILCLFTGALTLAVMPATVATVATPTSQSRTVASKSDSTSRRLISQLILQPDNNSAGQVTSVSQLSDVRPTDWAFQALQSLVERYGCIAGYPDGTFRGNRALTRYEFAAGLNACLNRVNELIAAGTSDLVRREDLVTLRRLQEEFATELTALRGRVDNLEAQTAQLEANQFSTTTKLNGEVIGAVIGATGGAPNTRNPDAIFVDRVRLNLITSFTGKDTLITGLQAYNLGGGPNSIGGALGLADPLGLSASNARVSFEPQFPGLDIKTLGAAQGGNSVTLYKLVYVFPVAKTLTLFAGPALESTDAGFGITPFYGEGQEAISRFAGLNPVARVSGGTSETGVASAGGFIWNIAKSVNLRAFYASVNANLPVNQGFPGTPLGAGLFGGSTVVEAQLDFKPSRNLDLALDYANSHHQINILATGLANADIGTLYGLPATQQVHINSVGGTATYRLSPKIALSGYGAAFFVYNDGGTTASTTLTSWMAGVHFTDLLQKGNAAGILFGQPLYRVDAGGAASLPANRTTPYHLEAYYRFQVNDNISITPGAFVLFNPEGNSRNSTTAVAILRTTFSF